MGWAIGYDSNWQRDIGYGVPATCDYPDCKKKIDRGLAYVCARQQPYGGEDGCGLFFCGKHADFEGFCERCAWNLEHYDPQKDNWRDLKGTFRPKEDRSIWIRWKLTHSSWKQWREENPEEVANMKALLESRRKNHVKSST